jgi:small subunit ribosomal protein S9
MTNVPFFRKTVGRRKTAISNLELFPGSGQIQINGRSAEKIFVDNPNSLLVVNRPFQTLICTTFDVKVKVQGGGRKRQTRAIQLALARALIIAQPKIRRLIRERNFLTRDSRAKERRKYGLKKARKASQFSKRLNYIYKLLYS